MDSYIQLIHETLDYIEDHLTAPIRVEDLSRHVYLSEFHFNRLFKTAVGLSPKQYILGRKMTRAVERLKNSRDPLIDIAYELGFEYPEVFSRAFKKHYGLAPRVYRAQQPPLRTVPKAEVVMRDWMNYQGTLVVKADFVELPPMELEGYWSAVNLSKPGYEQKLRAAGERFVTAWAGASYWDPHQFYSVVNCNSDEEGLYDVFIGGERRQPLSQIPLAQRQRDLAQRQVPGGWYAAFDYQGEMVDIRSTFVEDLFRWILVKNIRLNPNGVGMLTRYDDEYFRSYAVKIFVPILRDEPSV